MDSNRPESLSSFFESYLKGHGWQDLPVQDKEKIKEAFFVGSFTILDEIITLCNSGRSHKLPTHLADRLGEAKFVMKRLKRKPGLILTPAFKP